MAYKVEEGIDAKRFRRMVAGDGCFSRLPVKHSNKITEEDRNHIHLWRTVLDRAVLDLSGKDLTEKVEVIRWLDLKDKDFLQVCELAQLRPEDVYEQMWSIAEMLTEGVPPTPSTNNKQQERQVTDDR